MPSSELCVNNIADVNAVKLTPQDFALREEEGEDEETDMEVDELDKDDDEDIMHLYINNC